MPSIRASTSSSWLSWAMRIGRGMAVPLQPGGQAAPVPALEVRGQRGADGSSRPRRLAKASATSHAVRKFISARLLAAGEHGQHRAQPAHAGPARARRGVTISRRTRTGWRSRPAATRPAARSRRRTPPPSRRRGRCSRGSAAPRSTTSSPVRRRRRRPPSARCWPSTVARSCDPGRLAERVVLGDGEQRGDLHLRDLRRARPQP